MNLEIQALAHFDELKRRLEEHVDEHGILVVNYEEIEDIVSYLEEILILLTDDLPSY